MIKNPLTLKTGDILTTPNGRFAEIISINKIKGCKEFKIKIINDPYKTERVLKSTYLKMGPWEKWTQTN
jgi:hypothetical protein